MSYDVSIIIVNYHTSGQILNCLESIFRVTGQINYELIIVDNNSEPQIESLLTSKIGYPLSSHLRVISLPENVGFGRANNEGAKIAGGRNLFFLNPDTLLLNDAVKILSDFLDSQPRAGACGGNLYDKAKRPTFSFRRVLPGVFWELDELFNTIPQRIRYGKNRFFNSSGKILEVGYIVGADLMIKSHVFRQVGGFRNDFFMYYEETDLCAAIRRLGLKIYNVPSAHIIHLEGGSFGEKEEFPKTHKIDYVETGRFIYYRHNSSFIIRNISHFIYSLYLESRILMIRDEKKRDYYRKRKEYFLKNKKA